MTNILENRCDQNIEQLIPWFVTDKLEDEDLLLISSHIASCQSCAALVKDECKLIAAIEANREEAHEIPSNWDSFQKNLKATDLSPNDYHYVSNPPEESDFISPPPSNVIRFPLINRAKAIVTQPKTLGFIAMAQAAALVAIISIPNSPSTIGGTSEVDQNYDLLSGAGEVTSQANVIMQFNPEMTIKSFNALFLSNDIELVSGPTSANAYLVKIDENNLDAMLLKLRNNDDVMIAEPVSAE